MAAPTRPHRPFACPVCGVPTGRLDLYPGPYLKPKLTLNGNSSDDGARCRDHRRTLAERWRETCTVMATVAPGCIGGE